MAEKEVNAEDIDKDGIITVDEALVAAHKAYNSVDGYFCKKGQVKKLWGVDSGNLLFLVNDKGISTSVSVDTVAGGDSIYASINKDDKYYADWYTFFDNKKLNVVKDQPVRLKLMGHLGMAFTDEAKAELYHVNMV